MIDNFSHLFGKAKRVIKTLREEAVRNRKEGSRLLELEHKLATANHEKSGCESSRIDISTSSVARAALAILGIVTLGWFLLEIKNKSVP